MHLPNSSMTRRLVRTAAANEVSNYAAIPGSSGRRYSKGASKSVEWAMRRRNTARFPAPRATAGRSPAGSKRSRVVRARRRGPRFLENGGVLAG